MAYFLGKHVKHAAKFDSIDTTKKLTNTIGTLIKCLCLSIEYVLVISISKHRRSYSVKEGIKKDKKIQ